MPHRPLRPHAKSRSTSTGTTSRWIFSGLIVSVMVHALLLFWLNRVKIVQAARELISPPERAPLQLVPHDVAREKARETSELAPKPKETPKTMDQTDVLKNLPDLSKIDARPDIDVAKFQVPIDNPVLKGAEQGDANQIEGVDDVSVTRELGTVSTTAPVAIGDHATIDPGSLEVGEKEGNRNGDGVIKKGYGGKADIGALVGNLDALIGMPADVLVSQTTSLPSDTLFDYNKSVLKESARPSLLKIATLLDLHPEMFCWLDGFTDLFGSPVKNVELSISRAQSVKDYLVNSLKIPEARIIVRGFGQQNPLVASGSIEQQAPNRRVEMKLRKERPPVNAEPSPAVAQPAAPPAPTAPPAPKPVAKIPEAPVKRAEPAVVVKPAVIVRPKLAEPAEEIPAPPPRPKLAEPVEEEPAPPQRAEPVSPPAQPVRAVPITDDEP